MWLIRSTNISFVHLIKQVLLMNQTIYIATWDREIFFKTKPYWRWEIKILTKDTSFNIDENAVPNIIEMCLTMVHKYQLCTSNLTVPTHESNYVYRYVRSANSFSYKAIYALANGHFEHRCIIQYRWIFCPSHIEMWLKVQQIQLCTSHIDEKLYILLLTFVFFNKVHIISAMYI